MTTPQVTARKKCLMEIFQSLALPSAQSTDFRGKHRPTGAKDIGPVDSG